MYIYAQYNYMKYAELVINPPNVRWV